MLDSNTFELAVDYYNETLYASDDSVTFLLLDTLTNSKAFNPLFFFLFNKIVSRADGALAEVMGTYSFFMLYNYTYEVLDYFIKYSLKDSSQNLLMKYAELIGWEFSFDGKIVNNAINLSVGYGDFIIFMRNKINTDIPKNVETINRFLNYMEKAYMKFRGEK